LTRRDTGTIGRALRTRTAALWGRVRGHRSGSDPADFERLRIEIVNSPYFDAEFYLDQNPDVRASGADPATHYLIHGGAEGRDPSPRFDPHFYFESYPDVRTSGANPLVHYLRYGRAEGRLIRPLPPPAPTPAAPDDATWVDLAARFAATPSREHEPTVDVVEPVFAGFAETANCYRSVVEGRIATDTTQPRRLRPSSSGWTLLGRLSTAPPVRSERSPAGRPRSCAIS